MPTQPDEHSMLTYEDYVKFPEDGRRHEIIEGKHFVTAAPVPRNQSVLMRLIARVFELLEGGRAHGFCAPIDVHLSEFDLVQPDLIAIATDSSKLIGPTKIECAPALVDDRCEEELIREGRVESAAFPGFGFEVLSIF